ncbi:MAG: putative transposase [Alteromonadaceae bacterium]|jgi:putative transposase
MHRGNNRQDIFNSEDDMIRIKEDIEHGLEKSGCSLHAYVFMTNHLHLLITPESKGQLAVFMQAMANRYVRYFNAIQKRTGTMWEGRYKSCLVDSDSYLFSLYKYIEMNPVKANMVGDISEYKWSSYPYNALGEPDKLMTEHSLYTELGDSVELRSSRYKEMFDQLDINLQRKQITKATLAGEAYGSDAFHRKISKLVNRATKLASHGGDRKSEGFKNQAG